MSDPRLDIIKKSIREIPDFPKVRVVGHDDDLHHVPAPNQSCAGCQGLWARPPGACAPHQLLYNRCCRRQCTRLSRKRPPSPVHATGR